MRRPITPIACTLALLTGAWIGQAHALFAPTGIILASDPEHAAARVTVWRFYDAVDLLLRTGDDADLLDAVAPDFVDHADRPGLPPTRDGLVRYLASLRQTYPTLRLAPRDLVVEGDRVVAQLELTGDAGGSFLGIPLAGSRPWASVDIFRLAGGRIIEHWDDTYHRIVTQSLLSASLAVPPGPDLIPSLERVTYAPNASDHERGRHGPAVILVETGSVAVKIDGAGATVLPPPPPGPSVGSPLTASPAIGELAALAPGDALVAPAGVAFATRNPTDTPAIVLVLGLHPHQWPSAPNEPDADPVPLPSGITTRILAGGASATTEPEPHTVAVGRVTLGSGAQLASHQTIGTELLVVDAGTLTATFTGNAARAWLQYPDLGSTAAGNLEHLTADTGLSVSPNTVAAYRNDEATVLSLLIVTIVPATGIGAEPSPAVVPAEGKHRPGS